jgi:hypothetical protein
VASIRSPRKGPTTGNSSLIDESSLVDEPKLVHTTPAENLKPDKARSMVPPLDFSEFEEVDFSGEFEIE